MTLHQAHILQRHIAAELAAFRFAARGGDGATAWTALERAHVLSQPLLWHHLRVHAAMLAFGLRCGDAREVLGQLVRLALAPLGALTGRLPWGNSGRARVSAFAPAAIAPDLAQLLHESGVMGAEQTRSSSEPCVAKQRVGLEGKRA